MSIQDLLDKITASSAETVSSIEIDASKKAAAITESAQAEVSVIETDAIAAAKKAEVAVERATLAKARQAGKLIIQTAKREAFDDIMSAVEATVVGGDADKTQQFADKRADLEMHLSKQLG